MWLPRPSSASRSGEPEAQALPQPWTTEGGEKSLALGHASGQEVTHWLGGFCCRRPVRSRFLPFLLLLVLILPQSRQKHTGPAEKPRAQRETAE